jgi:Spy/CpxP family protein refolding chaperone
MKLWIVIAFASIGLLYAQPPGGRFGAKAKGGPLADLALTADQQNKIYTARADARVQTKGLREQASGLEDQLTAAIKAGDEAKIDSVSQDLSRLEGQITAIQSKAESRIYQTLTADQKAKLDKAPGGMNRMLRGRGPGGPPPPPPAQ